MADSVQFILDRLAHTFRELEALEIFSAEEVADIVKKRTDYEYLLKRRQLSPGDVYKYVEYEINLEKLRLLRCSKTMQVHAKNLLKKAMDEDNEPEEGVDSRDKKDKRKRKAEAKIAAHIKDRQNAIRNVQAASVRHICSVFERGIRRFPEEINLVLDYISFLKDELTPAVVPAKQGSKGHDQYLVVSNKTNSTTLNEVFGRALSLHPKHADLWVMAAMHELNTNQNIHAARTLFQRALRVNASSDVLWMSYFELELYNVMKIRERKRLSKKPRKDAQGVPLADDSAADGSDVIAETTEMLVGAPIVVLRHALKAIDNIDFAIKALQLARSIEGDAYEPLVFTFDKTVSTPEPTTLVQAVYSLLTSYFLENQDVAVSEHQSNNNNNISAIYNKGQAFLQSLLNDLTERVKQWNDAAPSEAHTSENTAIELDISISNRKRKAIQADAISRGMNVRNASNVADIVGKYLQEFSTMIVKAKPFIQQGTRKQDCTYNMLVWHGATDLLLSLSQVIGPMIATAPSTVLANGKDMNISTKVNADSNKKQKKNTKLSTANDNDISSPVNAAIEQLKAAFTEFISVVNASCTTGLPQNKSQQVHSEMTFLESIPQELAQVLFQIIGEQMNALLMKSERSVKPSTDSVLNEALAKRLFAIGTAGSNLNASATQIQTSLCIAVNAYSEFWNKLLFFYKDETHQQGISEEHMQHYCSQLLHLSPVLVQTMAGLSCLNSVVNVSSRVYMGENASELIGKAFLAAMVSPLCFSGQRGILVSNYLRWVWLQQQQLSTEKSLAGTLPNTHKSNNATADNKVLRLESVLLAVHSFVEKKVMAAPVLVAHGGMLHYYVSILNLAYTYWCALNGYNTDSTEETDSVFAVTPAVTVAKDNRGVITTVLQFLRKVADQAIDIANGLSKNTISTSKSMNVQQPTTRLLDISDIDMERIWYVREDIEARSGALQEASRIRWRKLRGI